MASHYFAGNSITPRRCSFHPTLSFPVNSSKLPCRATWRYTHECFCVLCAPRQLPPFTGHLSNANSTTKVHYTTTLTTTTQLGYVLPVCSQLSLRNVRMCITVVLCPIHHRQMVCLCWLSGSVWHRVLASGGRAFCPQSCLSPEYSDSPGLPGALPDSVTSGGGLQNSGASAHSCVIARETHIYVCSVEGSRYVLFIVKCTVMFHASCRGAARPVRFLRKHGWHM